MSIHSRPLSLWLLAVVLMSLSARLQAQYNVSTNGGVAIIVGYTGPGGSISIPSTLFNLPVVAIGTNAFQSKQITSVIIPDSVDTIYEGAFNGCSGLTNVEMGNVSIIGSGAFASCTGLRSFTVPDSVDTLGAGAFSGCQNLSYVTLGNGFLIIDSNTFAGCSSLVGVIIPDSVTDINEGAFAGCVALTSVTFSDGLDTIGESAFESCISLPSVAIPDSVTDIGIAAFYDCTSLTTVSIGDSLVSIGNEAFYSCYSLKSINIPDGVTDIGDEAFESCSNLTSMTIPDSVTDIGDYAFYRCVNLKQLIIPDSVTYLGDDVCYQCAALTNVIIGSGVSEIGTNAFCNCYGLESLQIGSHVDSIYNYAFSYCTNLTTIIIPDSVASIGGGAFSDCFNVTNFIIGAGLNDLENVALIGCDKLAVITVATNNATFSSKNGVLFDKDQETLIQYPPAKTGSYIIPNSVTAIGEYAFFDATLMNGVTIPNGVVGIGDYAFQNCYGLTTVTIPDGVETIGVEVFYGCENLLTVKIGSGIKSIGDYSFYDLPYLTSVYFGGDAPTLGTGVFEYDNELTIYHLPNTTGWDPDWGSTITVVYSPGTNPDLGAALNATNLAWTTFGDAVWFAETTNTHDGIGAAQSGIITNGQKSTIQTTVTGPGSLSFWWKTAAITGSYSLEFSLDTNFGNSIYLTQPWIQNYTVSIPAGLHTLTWTAYAFGSSNSIDAAFLDQVQFTTNVVATTPISITFDLEIFFQNGVNNCSVTPYIGSISPISSTTNEVVSPDGRAYSKVLPGSPYDSSGGVGEGYSTLDQLISACTNGLWTLYLNKGATNQQTFHFSVSMAGLTTNLLGPITALVPANNAVNVPTNTPFQWSGPTNFQTIFVDSYHLPDYTTTGYTNLSGNATNWPSPLAIPYGTNEWVIQYEADNTTNVTFTIPTDSNMVQIATWKPQDNLITYLYSPYVVGAPAPLPVQLTNSLTQSSPGNFQFGFQTLAGRPQTIQMRTNLTSGTWASVTNFIGDGSTRQFNFPITNSPGKYFRVLSQ